jgi:acyl carrier protein
MNPIVLKFVRRRVPDAEVADFDKAIWDLDLDSLDIAEMVEMLEQEFSVNADLEQVDDCTTPAQIKDYFRALIGTE